MSEQKITGACQCGAVTYEITGDAVMAGHCFCRDCQRASGASRASVAMYPKANVKISGEMVAYSSTAESGNTVTRHFCPTCGSRLFGENTGSEGVIGANAGCMDDPEMFEGGVVVYAARRPTWDAHVDSLPSFPAMPPMPS